MQYDLPDEIIYDPLRDADGCVPIKPGIEYCRDQRGQVVSLAVPNKLDLDAASTSQSLPFQRLPVELLDLIAFQLHPVDRICLALTCKLLLKQFCTGPILANAGQTWSQVLAPAPPKFFYSCHPLDEDPEDCSREIITRIEGTRASVNEVVLRLKCTHHASDVGTIRDPCLICSELTGGHILTCRHQSLGVDISDTIDDVCLICFELAGTARNLRPQLIRGWGGLSRNRYGYCTHCKRIKPTTVEYWLSQLEHEGRIADLQNLRTDHRDEDIKIWKVHASPTLRSILEADDGLRVIIQDWQSASSQPPAKEPYKTACDDEGEAIAAPEGNNCPDCLLQELQYMFNRYPPKNRGVKRKVKRSWRKFLERSLMDATIVGLLMWTGVTKVIEGSLKSK